MLITATKKDNTRINLLTGFGLGQLGDNLIQALVRKIRIRPEFGRDVVFQVLTELHTAKYLAS